MEHSRCGDNRREGLVIRWIAIPQEKEGPMLLSVGTKGDGATLYLQDTIQFLIWLGSGESLIAFSDVEQ